MQSSRQDIIQFLKSQHQKTGKDASIREICRRFGLGTKKLYTLFPGKKAEMCMAAGIPIDADSFQQVAKASQALKGKREQESLENQRLRVSREEEEKIARELKQVQAIEGSRERVRRLETTLASTPGGRKQIFSSPQRLLGFSQRMIDYESCMRENPSVWESFVEYCEKHNLDLTRKLSEIAGPLEEYEEHSDGDELHNYLGFKLEVFLLDREAEQKLKAMQGRFDEVLRNFRCNCGRRISKTFLSGSKLCCPCGADGTLKCVNCRHPLQFDKSKNVFHCHHCEMSFRVALRE